MTEYCRIQKVVEASLLALGLSSSGNYRVICREYSRSNCISSRRALVQTLVTGTGHLFDYR